MPIAKAEQPVSKASEYDERIKKLGEIKKLGVDPYPAKAGKRQAIAEIIADFSEAEKNHQQIFAAGRLRGLRGHGNLTFAHLEDSSGKIQIAFSKKEIGVDSYKIVTKLIDIGDFIGIEGEGFVTHQGENTILVKKWQILTKSLRPLPDKWSGLKDEEDRFRKRYLDILFNEEARDVVIKRAKFWKATRGFLQEKGFMEVETPILEITTGGADAKPFIAHHNALNLDVYLRISCGELWQKKLMVAGFEKTFEIGRVFRNEGMDAEHLQDYSAMEFYWGYADYEDGMKLVEEMYKHIAKETFGTLKFKIKNFDIDLNKKWERYDYVETVKKYTGLDISQATEAEIKKKLDELKVEYDKKGFNITRAIDNLWKYCRKQIAGPGFLVGVPITVSPLAKRDKENPERAERFQVILAGSELGNGYSELNDPGDQRERFEEQQKLRESGDEEAQMFDKDFIEALEYGMPPTCGFGFSERLFSFLMNKPMRETQIFPLMKPKD